MKGGEGEGRQSVNPRGQQVLSMSRGCAWCLPGHCFCSSWTRGEGGSGRRARSLEHGLWSGLEEGRVGFRDRDTGMKEAGTLVRGARASRSAKRQDSKSKFEKPRKKPKAKDRPASGAWGAVTFHAPGSSQCACWQEMSHHSPWAETFCHLTGDYLWGTEPSVFPCWLPVPCGTWTGGQAKFPRDKAFLHLLLAASRTWHMCNPPWCASDNHCWGQQNWIGSSQVSLRVVIFVVMLLSFICKKVFEE